MRARLWLNARPRNINHSVNISDYYVPSNKYYLAITPALKKLCLPGRQIQTGTQLYCDQQDNSAECSAAELPVGSGEI